MQIDFLEAADGTPLTKRFKRTGDEIHVTPYPLVKQVNSFRKEVKDPREFYNVLRFHAERQHCMLKGLLDRELRNESRAGHTDSTEATHWLLLDLDFDTGWSSVDRFLEDLNPEWSDVTYIWQHSSSAGIRYEPGLRGHLWIMLEEPIAPDVAKTWLRERNLQVGNLAQHLELTASGMSLRWGLDVTTCQNDKLIYIAPPILENLEDPLNERIQLVEKGRSLAPLPRTHLTPEAVENMAQEVIVRLRNEAGLPRRRPKYKDHGSENILSNPDEAAVTGVRRARGFVYLNLNGGDSWGYWFPEDNPELLHNFKDEPTVRLRDIAPEFYLDHRRRRVREKFGSVEAYVFREPLSDQYYNALYERDEGKLKLLAKSTSKDRLKDFLEQYGRALPDPVPDWTVEFDPTTTEILDAHSQWVNTFRPTDFILYGAQVTAVHQLPPVTEKILDSITAGDEETKEHFLNWLACLVQTRHHLGTAWVFHGVQGTGKGLLLSKLLAPILGSEQVAEWTTKEFEDPFNAQLARTNLLWLDEFKAASAKNVDSVMSRLKNIITEDTIPIRGMRTDTMVLPNWVNVIIATNYPDPVQLVQNDRRFNVSPAQEHPLRISPQQVAALDEEVWLFTSYLMNREADSGKAREVLQNEAREQMIESSQTSQERFFDALRQGDIDFFVQHLRDDMPTDAVLQYQRFDEIVRSWIARYIHSPEEALRILRDELRDVFQYVTGIPTTPTKFTRMCNIHRLHIDCQQIGGGFRARVTDIFFHSHELAELKRIAAESKGKRHLRLVNTEGDDNADG